MRRVYHDRSAAVLLALGLLLNSGCDLNRSSVGESDGPARALDGSVARGKDATAPAPALPTSSALPTAPVIPSTPVSSTSGMPSLAASDASVRDASSNDAAVNDAAVNDAAVDDAAVDDAAVDDAAVGAVNDAGTDADCDLSGSFALRIDADAAWAGTTLFNIVPIITPGTGTLSVVLLADLHADRTATFRACGANVPDFAASVGETYGVAFPDEVWEKLALRWSVGSSSTCLEPGCGLTFDLITAQLGIGIPERATWPTSRDKLDVATVRDDDGDGVPGVLLRCRGPKDPGAKKYTHPPTSYALNTRVSEIMIAIRIAALLNAKLESCDRFGGDIEMMSVDTRALACQLDTGARCLPEQLAFVDDNLPVWKVGNASFQAVRVSTATSCAEVRSVMLQ